MVIVVNKNISYFNESVKLIFYYFYMIIKNENLYSLIYDEIYVYISVNQIDAYYKGHTNLHQSKDYIIRCFPLTCIFVFDIFM
jgi:hypothetical protein